MAIDVRELRVGNYVSWLNNHFPYQGTAFYGTGQWEMENQKTIPLIHMDPYEYYQVAWEDLYPIPLSADLLLELGFEKDGFNNYNFFCPRNEFDYRAVVVDLNTGYIWFREGWKERNRIEDHLITLWNRDYDKNYYVHQLQNAVYALTGKELTYTNISK